MCQTKLVCVHLVRMIKAAGPTCCVAVEDLCAAWEKAEGWKAMWAKIVITRPDFAGLIDGRTPAALSLKLGGGFRRQPGANKTARIKGFLEMRKIREQSRNARAEAALAADDGAVAGPVAPRRATKPAGAEGVRLA
jgi:hypothetical protein